MLGDGSDAPGTRWGWHEFSSFTPVMDSPKPLNLRTTVHLLLLLLHSGRFLRRRLRVRGSAIRVRRCRRGLLSFRVRGGLFGRRG